MKNPNPFIVLFVHFPFGVLCILGMIAFMVVGTVVVLIELLLEVITEYVRSKMSAWKTRRG